MPQVQLSVLTWTVVIGISVGFYLVVFFLINQKLALLSYVFIMPIIAPLMEEVILIPGSKATVSLGGPLQAIILLLALWSVFTSRILRLKSAVIWTFILLWLIMGISMIESPDLIKAVKEWGRIGSFVFIYILAGLSFREEKDIRQFVRVLLLSTIVPLIVAAYQLATHTGLFAGAMDPYHRLMGTFGNPNGLAQFLSFPLLISLTIALDKESSGPRRLLFACLAFLFLITVSQTYSRSSWIGLLAGSLMIGFRRNRRLLFVIPVLILLLLAFVPLKSIRLGELETGKLKMSGRIDNWQMMLPLVMERPILGRGLTAMSDYTESDHVRLLLETGLLGWLSLVLLLWTLYRAGSRNLNSAGHGIDRNFALAFLAFFACTVTVGFAGTNIIFQYWFWVPAGIAMSKSIRRAGRTNDNDSGLVGRPFQDMTEVRTKAANMGGALSQESI